MERFDWKMIFKLNLFSLWVVGLWPKGDAYTFNIYTVYAAVSISFFISAFGILATINAFKINSDMDDSEEVIVFFALEVLINIKVFMFIKNLRLMKQIMTTLSNDMFQPKCLKQVLLIEPALNIWRIIYNILIAIGGPTITLRMLYPFLTKSRVLPLPAWYPYNIQISPLYEISFLHQFVTVLYSVVALYNIDMFIIALLVFVGAQCDIICDDLRNLNEKNFEIFNNKLIKFVKYHQEIVILAENFNNSFNIILLGQFLTSSVVLAFLLYLLAMMCCFQNKNLDVKFISHVVLASFYIVQIFTYCWLANEMEAK
ncbi:7tm 6 domain containing protein, partial [Asbolus verrucosus]